MSEETRVKLNSVGFKRRSDKTLQRLLLTTIAGVTLTSFACHNAHAFPIQTDNPNLTINLDSTVEVNILARTEDSSPDSYNNPNGDDVAQNFRNGLGASRVDLDTALNVVYKQDFGVRVSASAWYDAMYSFNTTNKSPGTINYLTNNPWEFSNGAKNLAGHDFELGDAFTYGSFNFGTDQRFSYRVGQFAQLWGESLFLLGDGIASGMDPIDGIRAQILLNPQFRDVALSTPQLSFTYKPFDALTFGAYYKLGWQQTTLPPGGSYFSPSDAIGVGANKLFLGGGAYFGRSTTISPSGGGAQFGAEALYNIGAYDLGAYFINFDDFAPALYFHPGQGFNPLTGQVGTYQTVYPRNIQIYAASATTDYDVFGLPVNFGLELSDRDNQPLTSPGSVAPVTASNNGSGNVYYPVGNVFVGLLSFIYASNPIPALHADALDVTGEVGVNKLLAVWQNKQNLYNKTDGLASDGTVVAGLEYYNIGKNIDMNPSLGVSDNYFGNSSFDGGTHGGGNTTVADTFTYRKIYNFTIQYKHYFGSLKTTLDGVSSPSQTLYGKDFVGFEADTSF